MSVRVATAARLWATAGEKQFSGDNMKKLISVFAALALVGSLAAQKKPAAKAPAKPAAPAAPAVAAPAAPAIAAPAAVPAAPAAGASSKGVGISISAYGGFTLPGGTSTSYGNSGSQTDGANAAIKYDLSNASALSGGATVAYEIAANLGLTLGFDFRSFKTRTYSGPLNSSPWTGILRDLAYTGNEATIGGLLAGGGCTNQCQTSAYADFGKSTSTLFKSDYGQETKWQNMALTLGIRPSVNLLGGQIYAGGGVAVILPYTTTTDVTFSNKAGALASSMPNSGQQKDEWNLGIGGFGEFGYTYNITDNVFAGIGVKVIMATANNSGKTRTLVANMPSGATKTATITIADSVTEAEKTLVTADGGTTYTAKQGVSTNGITDVTAQVIVGARF
jgi:hypothetical protein